MYRQEPTKKKETVKTTDSWGDDDDNINVIAIRSLLSHLPANGVSFGQVSMGFPREARKRNLNPNIFPVNPQNIDWPTQAISDGFKSWIEERIGKSLRDPQEEYACF